MGLDIVELFITVETEFGIEIPDAHAAELRTVGELYAYVLRMLHGANARSLIGTPAGQEIWSRLIRIVERETGAPLRDITAEASFVEDLRLD